MSNKKKPSSAEMREIRQMCRRLGKARGRISRKYSYEVLFQIKNFERLYTTLENNFNEQLEVGVIIPEEVSAV